MSEAKPDSLDAREKAWQKLATELGGEFANEEGWRQDKVHVKVGDFAVTLDFHGHVGHRLDSIYTRFATEVPRSEFRFRVFHQDLLATVAGLAGMQDIRVGDKPFDKTFVLQGTDKARVKKIFGDAGLRRILTSEPEVEISLRAPEPFAGLDFPEGFDEFVLEVPGKVEDGARLRRLFDAFVAVLGALRAR